MVRPASVSYTSYYYTYAVAHLPQSRHLCAGTEGPFCARSNHYITAFDDIEDLLEYVDVQGDQTSFHRCGTGRFGRKRTSDT
jgi:hypothetical protein